MSNRGTSWDEFRKDLNIPPEWEAEIQLYTDIISKTVEAREEKGLTQQALADLCGVKQPVIARLEKAAHSPQINTMLKILAPLGLKLAIVPLEEKERMQV